MKKSFFLIILCMILCTSGCSSNSKMKDGFYTAEMSKDSFGWKEYLCIMVKNNTIVYAEFNAKNASGYIKSWDNLYMENMLLENKTYPNEYTRNYVAQLIETQNPDEVDTISGATSSGTNFHKLSIAVINQAIKGDSSTVFVD